jgi:hypothetical protein
MTRHDGIAGLAGVVANAKPNATVTMPAAWVRDLLAYVREIEGTRAELLAACKAQHEAIDRLFAMLITATRSDVPSEAGMQFMPSKSGQPWDALVVGNAALAKAEAG